MNKSLHRPNRQFGLNIKNTLQDQEVESKLALKPKCRKRQQFSHYELTSTRPQMGYFDQVMKYAFTKISYPHILKGPQKVKRDVEALLHEITSVNGLNCLWHEDFLNEGKVEQSLFSNPQITLEKRTSLIDWIIAIHKKYTLRQETLYLTIKIIDDYCVKNDVPLRKYQLIGIASLFMAAKFEQIELPRFKDYHRLIEGQFDSAQMLEIESEILCKSQFSLTKKISSLWYMNAFAIEQIIFPPNPKWSKKALGQESRDGRPTATKQNVQSQDRFENFMQFSRYVLTLIQLDYKITTKCKQDIVAIATLLFTTIQKSFADSDGKGLMKFFIQTKSRLIEENETPQEISRHIKKCMKRIETLYSKKGEKRFQTINEKFNMGEGKLAV